MGKIAIGTPIFYPRKWVKAIPESAHKATLQFIKKEETYNKNNPEYARKIKPYDEIYQEKLRSRYAIPKKIGFDFVSLGWKTKWKSTDYRFEWSPMISFVFFKWQFVVFFIPEHQDHVWTSWLYYENDTDKTKSVKERIKQCKEGFPQNWIHYKGANSEGEKIDYYNLILKNKYL